MRSPLGPVPDMRSSSISFLAGLPWSLAKMLSSPTIKTDTSIRVLITGEGMTYELKMRHAQ